MRIEMIKRRRNAMQKYLRSDIAELLRIGLDSDAYGRVGRLYLDQNRTLSYDFVEQFCIIVSNHLKAMKDQSEWPNECKEAVPSLIYAASIYADLPELRKLRSLFSERYGKPLESFVNKEFINLLKPDCPTKDQKIQLMQEIVEEYGVEWDPKSLDHKLYKPLSSQHDCFANAYGDQDKESGVTDHKNGWMINIQETVKDDSNDHRKDESYVEIVKQTDNMRQRLLDYLSRTPSLLSTSGETSTSPEQSSTSSDDSTKSRSFFNFRLMPPPYVKNDPNRKGTNSVTLSNSPTNKQKHDGNKENEEVFNHPNFGIWDDEKAATKSRVKNIRQRKGGAPPRVKSHSTECLPNPAAVEEPIGHARAASYQPDLTVSPQTGHVHPKLPNYDDIIARFTALRAKKDQI